MTRLYPAALCIAAIGFAMADDSIGLCMEGVDDYQTAALDNEYVSDQPLPSQPGSCQLGIATVDDATYSISVLSEPSSPPGAPVRLVEPAGLTCLMTMQC